MLHSLLILAVVGCSQQAKPPVKADPQASEVLVVWNSKAPENKPIADRYVQARGIPKVNVLAISCATTENIRREEYLSDILKPVSHYIDYKNLKINYILLIRGVPIRIDNNEGYSVDAFLMVDAYKSRWEHPLDPFPFPKIDAQGNVEVDNSKLQKVVSPFFNKKVHFNSSTFKMYLATRLDGYTVKDAMNLVDNSVRAQPSKGIFLLDSSPGRATGSFGQIQATLDSAAKYLEGKKFTVAYDQRDEFIGRTSGLMGYASWGSNDGAFNADAYRSLGFRPGAIAETFVSTSGRTFRPTSGGQSLIADLISQGVTGVKGYVSEPFTMALAHVDILFRAYTSGYNLAESFYMASPLLKWKDVVIGDPLSNPYAGKT